MLKHLPGFLNHLGYGAAVAMTTGVLYHMMDAAPESRDPAF
jgi:hypothetical protein